MMKHISHIFAGAGLKPVPKVRLLFCLCVLSFFCMGQSSTPKPPPPPTVTSWWLSLDLGKTSDLSKLTILWGAAHGSTDYTIQGSNDNNTWANLLANQTSAGATTKEHTLTGSYRYVRIYINKAQNSYPIIYEVKLYGQEAEPPPPAVTSWWLSLDLGKASKLSKLSILWDAAYGSTDYSIQGSNDNNTWANILANQSSAGSSTKEHALTGSYRYVRIYINKAASAYPIIYETKLYGQAIIPLPTAPEISPVTSPTPFDYQTIKGTNSSDSAAIIVTCPTASVDPATKLTATTWSCELTNLFQGQNIVTVQARDAAGNLSSTVTTSIISDRPPKISNVSSSVFSKTSNKYAAGSMVKIAVTEAYNAQDIATASIRITSVSAGYDSGIQNLTAGTPLFYHWDTIGLKPASDYLATIKLTDKRGQSDQNSSLIISLIPNFSGPKILAGQVDLSIPAAGIAINISRSYFLGSGFNESLGFGWAHAYLMHIVETSDGVVKVFNADGSGSFFKPNPGGTYNPPKGEYRKLIKNPDGTFVLKGKYGGFVYFNAKGKLTAIEDNNGNQLGFNYTPNDLLDTIIDVSGKVTRFGYDADSHLILVTDPAGRVVSYAYDDNNNLVSATGVTGLKTAYAYDVEHHLTSVTYPSGSQTLFAIDANDRLVKSADKGGANSVTYQYDDNTSEMTLTDGLENQFVYTCNNFGLVTRSRDPAGNITIFGYDDDLNLINMTDPNGNQVNSTYDNLSNVLTKKDAREQTTTFTYEPQFNQIASITDSAGKITDFQYDSRGNLLAIIHPDNSQEKFGYDAQGNIVNKTDRKGQVINFEYTAAGQLSKKIFPDGAQQSFTYNNAGYLLSSNWAEGIISLVYDDSHRLEKVIYPEGDNIEYVYDAAGRLSQLIYPDGTAVIYGYDDVSRLSQINCSGQIVAAYLYDAMSRVIAKSLQNGVSSQFAYDKNSRLLSLVNKNPVQAVISSYGYSYDNVGNRLTMTTPEGTTQYLYDKLYRLIQVIPPAAGQTNYNYDEAGNRTTVAEDGSTSIYNSNNLNQYTQVNGNNYSYDGNGNLTSDGLKTYTYDYENRLISVEQQGVKTEYLYDPFGRRISKMTPTSITNYIYAGAHVIMEKDGAGAVKAKYIYGIGTDEILKMTRSGQDFYYCRDGLGSVAQITDSNGQVIEKYTYDAYGNTVIRNASGVLLSASPIGNTYGFTGRSLDYESGLYYYRARYYEPRLGRFLTPDPIGFGGGSNFYAYCLNNPVNFIDPSGRDKEYLGSVIAVGNYILDQAINIINVNPIGVAINTAEQIATLAVTRAEIAQLNNQTSIARASADNLGYKLMVGINSITAAENVAFHQAINDASNQSAPAVNTVTYRGGTIGGMSMTYMYRGDPTFVQTSERYVPPETNVQNSNGLVARISKPYEDSLVRAKIPVFGLAYGKDFKEFKVEYGEGKDPGKWMLIEKSANPQCKDNSPQILELSGDGSISGNLATWDTGLKNYVYGDEYPADHPVDLNGIYTLRLTVVNNAGEIAEDRVTVEVGSVIPNIYGGTAQSADKKVILTIPEQAINDSFRVISIKPASNGAASLSETQKLIGEVYEFRPAGEQFTKPVTLEMTLASDYSGKAGIYAYNSKTNKWENFPAKFDKQKKKLTTILSALPAKIALLEDSGALDICKLWVDRLAQDRKVAINSKNVPKGYLIFNNFDNDMGGWHNRDGDVGAVLSLADSYKPGAEKCLQLVDKNGGGNFASTITDVAFDAKKYPWVEFDYKISPEVKINFLVKMDGRWYDIEFTDDVKEYGRLNMEKIGKVENVIADSNWHTAGFNLYQMLKSHPALHGQNKFIIQAMIMADWDSAGYMKLVYGQNMKGAVYYLDNFSVNRTSHPAKDARQNTGISGSSAVIGSISAAENNTAKAGFVIEDFQSQNDSRGLMQGGLFHKAGAKGKISSCLNKDENSNTYLRIDFDVSKKGNYAGYYRLFDHLDLRQYNSLHLRIKAQQGNEAIRIGLKNKKGQEDKILVNIYLEKGITQEWQDVSIPLKAFVGLQDISSMENISFSIENELGNAAGAIFIDDISFGKEIVPLKLAKYSNFREKNSWGNESWAFKTNKAQINTRYDQQGSLIDYSGIISQRDQESWAGWGMSLNGVDASSYDKLIFRIKKGDGTEKPNLYLDDGLRKQYVNLEQYTTSSKDWQLVQIPLNDFIKRGIDVSHLQGIALVFEWQKMNGSLYIDDIAFLGTNGPAF